MKIHDKSNMHLALEQAKLAADQNEVPVGAVIVHNQTVIATGYNQPIQSHNPCAHAEIMALTEAGRTLNNYRLNECELYVTLEPCAMCVGAMVHARIKRCIIGASDPKSGALGGKFDLLSTPLFNHRFIVTSGVLADECAELLTDFFAKRR